MCQVAQQEPKKWGGRCCSRLQTIHYLDAENKKALSLPFSFPPRRTSAHLPPLLPPPPRMPITRLTVAVARPVGPAPAPATARAAAAANNIVSKPAARGEWGGQRGECTGGCGWTRCVRLGGEVGSVGPAAGGRRPQGSTTRGHHCKGQRAPGGSCSAPRPSLGHGARRGPALACAGHRGAVGWRGRGGSRARVRGTRSATSLQLSPPGRAAVRRALLLPPPPPSVETRSRRHHLPHPLPAPPDHPAVSHANLAARLRRMAAEDHPFMYGSHSLASRFASADPRGRVEGDACE